MKKNVASQVIGAQMCSATDGSDFTGAVTVYVTGDGGTQAAGGGVVTHEGNGLHTYAPTQAETNYDHVAFTFKGTGALTVSIQVYPAFPQTGDAYAVVNSGTHGNAALKALIDAVDNYIDTEIAAIISTLGTPGVSIAADLAAVAAYLDTEVAAILADTNELQTAWANGGRLDLILDARASQVSVDTVDAVTDAIKAKTDSLTFTDAGKVDATLQIAADLKAAVANRVADHVLRRSLATALASADGDAKGFRSMAGAVAKLVNKVAISGANLITYEPNDTTVLGTQALTTDAAAEPITGVDTV